ncbi:MAG: hypothetical protein E3J72_11085 [Planctomycetota bacterium]|nr:MAG: hypothetical protein E3J72_11085 [Planctomycetota bacterium]
MMDTDNAGGTPAPGETDNTDAGGKDPLASRFISGYDPNAGRPAFFFFKDSAEKQDVEKRVQEVAGSIPALLCTVWYGEEGELAALTISNVDASGERHGLGIYFRDVSVRTAPNGTVHLELSTAPCIRQVQGAGTLFIDASETACYFRLDIPKEIGE